MSTNTSKLHMYKVLEACDASIQSVTVKKASHEKIKAL